MMTGDEYQAFLKRYDLTHVAAAAWLGVNEVTSRRWASGRWPVPPAISMLLRLMLKLRWSPETVKEMLDEPR